MDEKTGLLGFDMQSGFIILSEGLSFEIDAVVSVSV